jgi:hypothetical protein
MVGCAIPTSSTGHAPGDINTIPQSNSAHLTARSVADRGFQTGLSNKGIKRTAIAASYLGSGRNSIVP